MRGSERRKLAGLRAAIDGVPEEHRGAIAKMARMLGPDRLGGIEEEIGAGKGNGKAGRSSMASRVRHLRPDELPKEVSCMKLEWFGLGEAARDALADAGIITVWDFISRTMDEIVEGLGVPKAAADEARTRLLGYGIRTVDNPPLR